MNRVAELTWPTAVGSGALLGVMVALAIMGLFLWFSRNWSTRAIQISVYWLAAIWVMLICLVLCDRWLEAHGETTTREMLIRWLQPKHSARCETVTATLWKPLGALAPQTKVKPPEPLIARRQTSSLNRGLGCEVVATVPVSCLQIISRSYDDTRMTPNVGAEPPRKEKYE